MQKRFNWRGILAMIFLVLFVITAVSLNKFSKIDTFINSYFSAFNNQIIIGASEILHYLFEPLNVIIIALLISVIIWFRGLKKDSYILAGISLISVILAYFIKGITHRVRPLNQLIADSGYAFPSGHALTSMVLFGFLIYLISRHMKNKTLKTILIAILSVIILGIGISRPVLGMHWISDILGGWLIGLTVLLAGIAMKR